MGGARGIIRWTVRGLLLVAAGFLAIGGPLPPMLARVFPGLSPFVLLVDSIIQRRWYAGLFWTAPAVIFLILAFFRGQIFCRWICPAGTIYSISSRFSLNKYILKVHLGGFIFWMVIFASLVGTPIFLFLDPLSTFNRLPALVRGAYSTAALVPGLLLPLFFVLGFLQPMIWCRHFCPLGYMFVLARSLRSWGVKKTFSRTRREILAGLFVGLPLAVLARRLLFTTVRKGKDFPLLPPGADNVERFTSACTRCYVCVNACPSEIIKISSPLDRPVDQWFLPTVRYFVDEDNPDIGYCPEFCNECCKVCPTGAIKSLTLEEKQNCQIGIARVIHDACLAWADNEFCMVCQEHCPYDAIDIDYSEDDVPRPVVNAAACRGCGMCYNKCPATRAGKAIVVDGVARQKEVAKQRRRIRRRERSRMGRGG